MSVKKTETEKNQMWTEMTFEKFVDMISYHTNRLREEQEKGNGIIITPAKKSKPLHKINQNINRINSYPMNLHIEMRRISQEEQDLLKATCRELGNVIKNCQVVGGKF